MSELLGVFAALFSSVCGSLLAEPFCLSSFYTVCCFRLAAICAVLRREREGERGRERERERERERFHLPTTIQISEITCDLIRCNVFFDRLLQVMVSCRIDHISRVNIYQVQAIAYRIFTRTSSCLCHLVGNLNWLRPLVNRSFHCIQHHLRLPGDSRPLPLRLAPSVPDVLHKPR